MLFEYEDIKQVYESAKIIVRNGGKCDFIKCKDCMFNYKNVKSRRYVDCDDVIFEFASRYLEKVEDADVNMVELALRLINIVDNPTIINLEEIEWEK